MAEYPDPQDPPDTSHSSTLPTPTRRGGWRRLLGPLRFLVSGGLLTYLVWQADPQAVWAAWRAVDLQLLGLALLLQLAGIALSAAKWGVVLRSGGQSQPYLWLLNSYMVGQFANNFLPTTVGGDALRAMQLGRRIGSYSQASASIFIERLTGFLALSLIALTALLLSALRAGGVALTTDTWMLWVTGGFAVLASGAAVASFAAPLWGRLLGRYLPERAHKPIDKISAALAAYFPRGRGLLAVVLMSLAFQSTWVLIHAVCGAALGIEAPLLLYALMAPLTDILGLLPIFVNNVGAREFIFTLYLSQVGVEPALAISLAFLILTLRLVASLPGGVLVLLGGSDLRVTARSDQTVEGQVPVDDANVLPPTASHHETVSRES